MVMAADRRHARLMTSNNLTAPRVPEYTTRFGSLLDYEKAGVEAIDDDPKHYAFSNAFEVASQARPWEKVVVARNQQYVLKAVRAEGTSDWRTAAHDEFALLMDGSVEVELVALNEPAAAPNSEGSITLEDEPGRRPMGRIGCRRGHMALLRANAAYRLRAETPGVVLVRTIDGRDSIERRPEICQTA
jgi:hypothetical protein